MERVAVLSEMRDEIADGVRDNCGEWKGTPYIPGRSRFRMMYKGEEIIKPLRKTMKKLAQEVHNKKYCGETRHGRLENASEELWGNATDAKQMWRNTIRQGKTNVSLAHDKTCSGQEGHC